MKIDVTYMSGAGNLFSVIDNRQVQIPFLEMPKIAIMLCGINDINKMKTDGMIILSEGSNGSSFDALFFNPDGSYGAMCGNGSRCAVSFTNEKKFYEINDNSSLQTFKMSGRKYNFRINYDLIEIYLPKPRKIIMDKIIELGTYSLTGTYVDVDSDHYVIKYNKIPANNKDFRDFNLNEFAPQVRNHKSFDPKGVNVNIFEINEGKIHLRTFERGVEAETGACGTGAVSTALSAALNGLVNFPVSIIPTSGIPLKVDIVGNLPCDIEFLVLAGTAEILSSTEIALPQNYI
jgi:diaminopimelate epimerase